MTVGRSSGSIVSCKKVLFQRTSSDQTRRLLDLLPTRGPKAFSVFVKSLLDEYDWIADELQKDLSIDEDYLEVENVK